MALFRNSRALLKRRVPRILFIGAPGVGKGAYSTRLADAMNLKMLITGDILRSEIAAGTPLGNQIRDQVQSGALVSDHLIMETILPRARELGSGSGGYILDGFPRTAKQARLMSEADDSLVNLVVYLTQPFPVIVSKLDGRRVCGSCGWTCNYASIDSHGMKMPPLMPKVLDVCDQCGGALQQRQDDKKDVILKRLDTFQETVDPLLAHFGDKVIRFDALGGTKEFYPKFEIKVRDALGSVV